MYFLTIADIISNMCSYYAEKTDTVFALGVRICTQVAQYNLQRLVHIHCISSAIIISATKLYEGNKLSSL